MARRGNLLRNGNFVLGTTEDWVIRPYDLGDEGASLTLSTPGFYGSDYKGDFNCPEEDKLYYLMYDKVCDFEKSPAYIYSVLVYLDLFGSVDGILYGLEDNNYYLQHIPFGYVSTPIEWIWLNCILREINNLSHFKVGLRVNTEGVAGWVFIGCAKLIPVSSVKSLVLREYIKRDNLTTSFTYSGKNACLGRCKMFSILTVGDVSGTDPQLNVSVRISSNDYPDSYIVLDHQPFTEPASEMRVLELPQIIKYDVFYSVSGTDPVIDMRHLIMITPL